MAEIGWPKPVFRETDHTLDKITIKGRLEMSISTTAIPRENPVRRVAGIVLGVTIHLLFGVTVWYVYHFFWRTTGTPSANAIWIDTLLGLQFGVSHSLLLCPPVRKFLGRWISRSFYGCGFCLMTCLSLGLAIWQWRTIPGVIWQATGIFEWLFWIGFIGSWIGLFYSLSLVGLGYQTGFTEWSHWVRRRPLPPRTFTPRGAYFILRHPVYLSFLGLLWFTPSMTADRALLTGIWTVYIYIGSWLKDLRLAYFLGDSYREYCSRVPGYPGMFIGPMARWHSPTAAVDNGETAPDPQPATA